MATQAKKLKEGAGLSASGDDSRADKGRPPMAHGESPDKAYVDQAIVMAVGGVQERLLTQLGQLAERLAALESDMRDMPSKAAVAADVNNTRDQIANDKRILAEARAMIDHVNALLEEGVPDGRARAALALIGEHFAATAPGLMSHLQPPAKAIAEACAALKPAATKDEEKAHG